MTLQEMDQTYVLPTYGRNYVNFVSGRNATLTDDAGKEYIDFTSGIGVTSVGHGNEKLASALAEQARKMIHISNLYLIEPQARLAKKLVELSGYDMRCFFANSGAEANEGAIKIARKYGEVDGEPKRYKIITLENSFHGRTITALKATGQEKMHNYFGPFPDGFVYARSVEQIPSLIDDHTVAVMIEVVQGEGGVMALDFDRVKALSEELKKRDVLLMVDEVQTGVYRTGELLASRLYDIEPDVITLAKGLGGGVPIGVIMTKHKEIFAPGDHGSTFGGNYLSTTAGLSVLEMLSELHEKGALGGAILSFHEKMKETAAKFSEIIDHETGLGLMRAFVLKDESRQAAIVQKAFEHGVLVLKAGKGRIRFLPPLTISPEEMNEGFARLHDALAAL